MSSSPTPDSGPGVAERMGLHPGMIVLEIGYDEDVDLQIRALIRERTGEEILPEESDEVADVVLLWYREDDGDLGDVLVDAIAPLDGSGFIWLLTPKRGRDGYVDPTEISEAAAIAGLSQTSISTAGDGWSAARLVGRKSSGGKR